MSDQTVDLLSELSNLKNRVASLEALNEKTWAKASISLGEEFSTLKDRFESIVSRYFPAHFTSHPAGPQPPTVTVIPTDTAVG